MIDIYDVHVSTRWECRDVNAKGFRPTSPRVRTAAMCNVAATFFLSFCKVLPLNSRSVTTAMITSGTTSGPFYGWEGHQSQKILVLLIWCYRGFVFYQNLPGLAVGPIHLFKPLGESKLGGWLDMPTAFAAEPWHHWQQSLSLDILMFHLRGFILCVGIFQYFEVFIFVCFL